MSVRQQWVVLLGIFAGMAVGCAASAVPGESSSVKPQRQWTQFRGPNRDNLSAETGLLKRWPDGGPKLLWRATGLGPAYSAVSVVDGVIYTMGNQGDDQAILALDTRDGSILWKARNGEAFYQGRGDGPRGTPTIDGSRLYALGGRGELSCVDLRTHEIVWEKNILEEFGGSNISWGISESVLIDGNKLICTPGGSEATIVALDKKTGEVIWKSLVEGRDRRGYASSIVAEVGGVRQYIQFTSRGTIGVRADDGKFLWRDNAAANGTANCSTVVFADGYVFSSSGYQKGSALVKLIPDGEGTAAKFQYHTRDLANHHGGLVLIDGYGYGTNNGNVSCLEMKTGKVMWKDRSVGKGALTYADGHLYLRSEGGPVALIEATPEGYREKGRFSQPDRSSKPAWSHPVVADGKLFLRDMDILLCYDLRE